jgi:hypothetical protein
VTPEHYFSGRPESKRLYDAVRQVIDRLGGGTTIHASKSQIAFRRRTGFAFVWAPAQYLRGTDMPALVLTVGLRRRDGSPRWKQIVEPYPGRFTHHLELRSPGEVDAEVEAWLREAWGLAA